MPAFSGTIYLTGETSLSANIVVKDPHGSSRMAGTGSFTADSHISVHHAVPELMFGQGSLDIASNVPTKHGEALLSGGASFIAYGDVTTRHGSAHLSGSSTLSANVNNTVEHASARFAGVGSLSVVRRPIAVFYGDGRFTANSLVYPRAVALTTGNEDRHIRRGPADYAQAMMALLPTGLAWPREPDSVLYRVVAGLSYIYGYIDARAADLLERESDPRITTELLSDWERAWGLPDHCLDEPLTIGDRRKQLLYRMTVEGAQSRAFFIGAAQHIGYEVTITEYRPFMVGLDVVGDGRVVLDDAGTLGFNGKPGEFPNYGLGDPIMRFYWTMHVHLVRLTWFRCAAGQCGIDPHLRIALATDLECLIRRWRPAHTEVGFDYSGVLPYGDEFAGTP